MLAWIVEVTSLQSPVLKRTAPVTSSELFSLVVSSDISKIVPFESNVTRERVLILPNPLYVCCGDVCVLCSFVCVYCVFVYVHKYSSIPYSRKIWRGINFWQFGESE